MNLDREHLMDRFWNRDEGVIHDLCDELERGTAVVDWWGPERFAEIRALVVERNEARRIADLWGKFAKTMTAEDFQEAQAAYILRSWRVGGN